MLTNFDDDWGHTRYRTYNQYDQMETLFVQYWANYINYKITQSRFKICNISPNLVTLATTTTTIIFSNRSYATKKPIFGLLFKPTFFIFRLWKSL